MKILNIFKDSGCLKIVAVYWLFINCYKRNLSGKKSVKNFN